MHLADLAVEISRLASLRAADVSRRVQYEQGFGVEPYRIAKQLNRPVLFITGHVGAWELLPYAHALLTEPLSFVVRPLDNPYLERHLRKIRERGGNRCLSKKDAAREILRALSAGADVGVLIDQNVNDDERLFVNFFGIPAATSPAPALLALRTNATVIPGFMVPGERPGDYKIRFYPEIQLIRSDDRQKDILVNTQAFTRCIEDVVRQFPQIWLWGHRRWKTRPAGDDWDPYAGL